MLNKKLGRNGSTLKEVLRARLNEPKAKGLSQMQISERLRQLFFYALKKNAKNKEKINNNLVEQIKSLLEASRQKIAVEVNTTLLYTYWQIGRIIASFFDL